MMRSAVTTASPAASAEAAPAERPDVSFITVTYGTGAIIIDTLASLVTSLAESAIAYEIIVVDNLHPARPTRARTELLLRTSGIMLVTPQTNLGFGGGCELGALHARGDILAFVNPDVHFEPGWLEPLLTTLDTARTDGREPSIVSPVLLDPDGSVQEVGQALLCSGRTRPTTERPAGAAPIEVDYASAACWLMRRDEHERIGGFDPAYHPAYFEDVDLALRARSLGGHAVVRPDVAVVHHRGTGTPDRPASAVDQLAVLIETWPEIRWRQPARSRPV